MSAEYVLSCDIANYDAATATCSAPYYAPAPQLIPTLSVSDAQAIGLSIAALWGLAFGIRMIKRALTQIG